MQHSTIHTSRWSHQDIREEKLGKMKAGVGVAHQKWKVFLCSGGGDDDLGNDKDLKCH